MPPLDLLNAIGGGLLAIALAWIGWRSSPSRLREATVDQFGDMLAELQKTMLERLNEAVARCVGLGEIMDHQVDRLLTVRNRITTERARMENPAMGRKNGRVDPEEAERAQNEAEIDRFLRERGGAA